jgi:hypothetical protein
MSCATIGDSAHRWGTIDPNDHRKAGHFAPSLLNILRPFRAPLDRSVECPGEGGNARRESNTKCRGLDQEPGWRASTDVGKALARILP